MKKINTTDFRKIWFGSDFHLGHDKEFIWRKRGFRSRDEHTEFILSSLEEYVKPDDAVFFMGDLALTCTSEEFEGYMKRIEALGAHWYIILGNHDHRFEEYLNDQDELAIWERDLNFDLLGQYAEIQITEPSHKKGVKGRKTQITLCHFPLEIWNHCQHGAWHLCGHSHGSFQRTTVDWTSGKRLDVGIDSVFRWTRVLFDFEELRTIMKNKGIEKLDHH